MTTIREAGRPESAGGEARHFHSETGKPAKSGPSALIEMLAVRSGLIRHILESRLKCALRQILVQSPKMPAQTRQRYRGVATAAPVPQTGDFG